MSHKLTKREVNALERIDIESQARQGDFAIPGTFGSGAGKATLAHLKELGLIEEGPSKRYHGSLGYRLTLDGERCLHGKTWAEIIAGDEPNVAPKVKRWPPEG